MDEVAAVEAELGFGSYETKLKAVKGFYKNLLLARGKAKANPKFVPAYRSLLEKGIAQARATEARDAPLEGEALTKAIDGFWALYDECRARYGIETKEQNRFPQLLEEWVEHFLPERWKAYSDAMTHWLEKATPTAMERLKQATEAMVKAYAEGS